MKQTSIYTHDGAYAREHGELTQFRESLLANIACKDAIEASIRSHFDGMHLGKEVLPDVMREYSPNRVALVLAATIQLKEHDGRFSNSNKEWASAIDTSFSISPGNDHRTSFCVESHPAVLDGFVSMFRKEMCRERKPSVIAKLQAKNSQPRLTAPNGLSARTSGVEL